MEFQGWGRLGMGLRGGYCGSITECCEQFLFSLNDNISYPPIPPPPAPDAWALFIRPIPQTRPITTSSCLSLLSATGISAI